MAEVISNYPANGNLLNGESENIAPYYDFNNDGVYNPSNGDFPLIRGDQAVLFIMNDVARLHLESQSNPLGVEILGMAYAFDAPFDSTLNNTIFFHYDIINKSEVDYHDTYLGIFTDFDLGFYQDDRIQSDVEKGMFFAYNGKPVDGNGQSNAYGDNPPAIGVKVIEDRCKAKGRIKYYISVIYSNKFVIFVA
jgi:hypothetical protein